MALSCAGGQSFAQEGRNVGEGFLYSSELQADAYYSDNFYNQARNRDDVFGTILKPSARILTDRGRIKLGLKTDAQFGIFDSPSSNDNYIDSNTEAALEWKPTSLHRTSFTVRHVQGHDPFGLQRTEAVPATIGADLDVWHSDGAELNYRYGNKDAPLNIEFSVNAAQKHYDANRAAPNFSSQLDNNNIALRSEILYTYSPKTAAVLEASATRIFFTDDAFRNRNRNGTAKSILGGVRWKATAQTAGDARVGYLMRNFDNTPDRRFHALNWSASVTWTPLVLTAFKLTTGRLSQDSFNSASVIDNRFSRLEIAQKISDRLSSTFTGGYSRTEFIGNPTERNDDTYSAGLNATYALDRTLSLVAGANYVQRESDFPVNIADLNYDSSTAFFGLRLTP